MLVRIFRLIDLGRNLPVQAVNLEELPTYVFTETPTILPSGFENGNQVVVSNYVKLSGALYNNLSIDTLSTPEGLYTPAFYIEVTKNQLDTLITNSALIKGATYRVLGIDPSINTEGSFSVVGYFKAIENNKISTDGIGLFYNPKYESFPIWDPYSTLVTVSNQTGVFQINETVTANNGATATLFDDARGLLIPLTGDWTTATSITGNITGYTATVSGFSQKIAYGDGQIVIWGGKMWINLTGSAIIGSAIDPYNLTGGWQALAYGQSTHNIAYDEIKYDYANDFIYYRRDSNGNEVSTYLERDTALRPDDESAIMAFQWGRSTTTGNRVINSYCRNINNRFDNFRNNLIQDDSLVLDNYSYATGTFSENIISGSTVSFNSINFGSFSNNIIESNSSVLSNRFYNNNVTDNSIKLSSELSTNSIYGVPVNYNIIEGDSSVINNFKNCTILSNTFFNKSYCNGNAFTGSTDFGGLTATGISHNNCSNFSGFYQNRQLSGSAGAYVSENSLRNGSEIGSNILSEGSDIMYNTLSSASGIQNNNCTYFLCEYNELSFSSISSNTGDIEIYRNSLSSFSSINSNTTINAGYLQINHNTLVSESGITFLRPNASNTTIRYNYIKAGSIAYVDFTNDAYMRNINIEDERYNRRATTRITVSEPVYDCSITSNEMLLTIQKTVTGAAGEGATGSLNIQTYVIPTNFFIDEVWLDLRTGITYGATAALNVGLETDGTTSGLDNTQGDLATVNNLITKVVETSYVPATGNRLLVASVQNASLTAGTLYLKVKLKKLKRITFP